MAESNTLVDYRGRTVRLTDERWAHILTHPEMAEQRERLGETLAAPDVVVVTVKDESVYAYHRLYEQTPVTRKYLVVVVKIGIEDAFILTAYFAGRLKRGMIVWLP